MEMQSFYQGKKVNTKEELSAYSGVSAVNVIVREDCRKVFEVNHAQMKANYDSGVDFQLRNNCSLLCPQTADFLYSQFTPETACYKRGSRPVLEKIVKRLIRNLKTERERALILMRFCRDLYKKYPDRNNHDADYIFGGTEEQLIEKGEELCECLGRLFVALCEIAGIPARYVIHISGGHIVAEAYVESKWAYIDPRCGVYFLKPDGQFASTWDIWNDPNIIYQQSATVKADISERWTWEERAWKCKNIFFAPQEITGLANYSLNDSSRYKYSQVSQALATKLGLWKQNKIYRSLIRRIFGISQDMWCLSWERRQLRKVPLIYRNDGFTPFYHKPISAKQMSEHFIEPLSGTNVNILEWGLGPGSVFCYDTKAGQVFLEDLTEQQRSKLRHGDINVWQNVTGMIRRGIDPLKFAVTRGHELGLEVYSRLEMNHEYGPASDDNWMWVALVGDFNKNNPQFRIPGSSAHLDFKYTEVREFKLAILREAVERGSDGISLDFSVYPPHFENPDPEILTEFIRDVRKMTNEAAAVRNRRIKLMVRFPARTAEKIGLDWKRLMQETLVDAVVPSFSTCSAKEFDIDIDEFISMRNRTGVKVYGCLWQALGFFTTDPTPEDEKAGRKYDKPKTKDLYFAQAMLLHRAGVDGLQLAMSSDEWRHNPFFNTLADPEKMLYSDKRYMVNQESPVKVLTLRSGESQAVSLRIADDPVQALKDGQKPRAVILVYCNRLLEENEKLDIQVNTARKFSLTAETLAWNKPVSGEIDLFDPDWWRTGEYSLEIKASLLKLGTNRLEFTCFCSPTEKLEIRWIDLKIEYQKNPCLKEVAL